MTFDQALTLLLDADHSAHLRSEAATRLGAMPFDWARRDEALDALVHVLNEDSPVAAAALLVLPRLDRWLAVGERDGLIVRARGEAAALQSDEHLALHDAELGEVYELDTIRSLEHRLAAPPSWLRALPRY